MDKRILKKTGEELQQFLHFKKRHGISKLKKERVLILEKININKIAKILSKIYNMEMS